MKLLISIIMALWSRIYTFGMSRRLADMRRYAWSKWLSREFGQADDVVIFPGLELVGGRYITIGRRTSLGRNGVLQAWDAHGNQKFTPSIVIGERCSIGDGFNISAVDSISIGDDVLTGRNITILDNNHGTTTIESLHIPPIERSIVATGPVRIESKVWIGDKVTILGGVTIGEGAIVAANAVVTHDIPPYSVAAGVPAKIIKSNHPTK